VIILLDNTVLTNFAGVKRPELLQAVFGPDIATTSQVMAEFNAGVALGHTPMTDWHWLPVLTLTPAEQTLYRQLLRRVNAGEASCLAVATVRHGQVMTDDLDGRKLAAQMKLSISGTIGVLIRLVQTGQLTLMEANHLLQEMVARGYHAPFNKLDSLL
jgi:predicted nucleic acid-binding protein